MPFKFFNSETYGHISRGTFLQGRRGVKGLSIEFSAGRKCLGIIPFTEIKLSGNNFLIGKIRKIRYF